MEGAEASEPVLRCYRLQGVQETSLGVGDRMMEVDYLGVRCTALRLFQQEEDDDDDDVESTRVRLADCCASLSRLRHPHIAQFLGVSFDSSSPRRALIVTEYLPVSLAAYISQSGGIPEEICYSILCDVALGLRYLHEQTPPVVHGDLSAKTVHISRDFAAKISGAGLPRSYGHLTEISGSFPWHLPPEVASSRGAMMDSKTDIFSFGIVMLHALSGRPPVPKDCTANSSSEVADSPGAEVLPSQINLRKEYIDILKPNHPLMQTLLNCLQDQPALRQDIQPVALHLSELTSTTLLHNHRLSDTLLASDSFTSESLICRNHLFRSESSTTSDSAFSSIVNEVEKLQLRVHTLTAENMLLKVSLAASQDSVASKKCSTNSLEFSQLTSDQVKLHWEECAELPVGMFRAQAIIFNDCVYVGGGLTEDDYYDYCVFEYNPDMNLWNLLPPAPVKLFGLGVFSAELVLIGGMSNHDSISDRMFAFDKYLQTWKELVCVLSTARFSPTIVQYESTLIMIGGVAGSTTDDDLKNLTSVEYLVPELSEWVVLGHLPKSSNVCSPSTAQEKGMLYILGGYTTQSAISSTRRGHYSCLSTFLSASGVKLNLWKSLPDTPYLQTTALSLGGCLLALGGTEQPYAEPIHREIYTYNVETELWVKVAELPLACCHCTAVVLPEGTVLLLGGWVRPGKMRASRAVFKGVLSVNVNSEDSSS